MKTLFLIPPSEGKKQWWDLINEKLSYDFEKPYEIVKNASEKDLKCKDERYKEAIKLNTNLENISDNNFMKAIERYTWVMFSNIDYFNLSYDSKKFFDDYFSILSWFYWLVSPKDQISNYKLPVETKWIYNFFSDSISKKIIEQKYDYLVNLLPDSYAKLIWLGTTCSRHKKKRDIILDSGTKIISIVFIKSETWKKVSHWVKKIKGQLIKYICENKINDLSSWFSENIYKSIWAKYQEIENLWNQIHVRLYF